MILYTNGAEVTAGAFAKAPYYSGGDDSKFHYMFSLPHPDNVDAAYPKLLSTLMKARLNLDAQSGASNERIIRRTLEFIDRKQEEEIFVLLGIAPWDRVEWHFDHKYYQIGVDNITEIPQPLKRKYSGFLKKQDRGKNERKWHKELWNLHKTLKEKKINHLFVNECDYFSTLTKKHRWGPNYLSPYTEEDTMVGFSEVHNFTPTHTNPTLYGEEAHSKFAQHLISHILGVMNGSK